MLEVIVLALIMPACFEDGIISVEELQRIAIRVNRLRTTWTARTDFRVTTSNTNSNTAEELLHSEDSDHNNGSQECKDIFECFYKMFTSSSLDKYYESPQDRRLELPESFDSRKQWPMCPSIGHTDVQGNCGSCWAISVVSAFADRICIKSEGKNKLPRSSQQLLSCCRECMHDGCKTGGNVIDAWLYLKREGVVTGGDYGSGEGCQPYQIQPCAKIPQLANPDVPVCESLPFGTVPKCQHKCSNQEYSTAYRKDKVKAKKVYRLPNERAAQIEMLKNGPIVTGFMVYRDLYTYSSGVYKHITGMPVGLHAVRVIGWGVENGVKYWLVVNSWNLNWGEEGTFRIIRGDNSQSYLDFENAFITGTVDW